MITASQEAPTERISIIVPVHNVVQYLEKCLDSILCQTYENLEIFCIDDGSTDGSEAICDRYAEADARITVFHQEKQGVSVARNVGLYHATGKYIGFVDSDDWIEPNMYEVLLAAMQSKKASISICSYYKEDETATFVAENEQIICDAVIAPRDMLLYPLKRDDYYGFCGYLWNKLFLADLFHESKLMFNSHVRYGEDIWLYSEMVAKTQCHGVYIEKPLYHYRQRREAASKTTDLEMRRDILKVYKQVEALLEENSYADSSFWARGFYCHHASVIAEMAMKQGDRETLACMQEEIRTYLEDFIETNRTNADKAAKLERMHRLLHG